MLTLFHAPRSRSGRIVWLLEEIGVDVRRGVGAHGAFHQRRDGLFEGSANIFHERGFDDRALALHKLRRDGDRQIA